MGKTLLPWFVLCTWFPGKIGLVGGYQARLPEKAFEYFYGVSSTFQGGRDEGRGLAHCVQGLDLQAQLWGARPA